MEYLKILIFILFSIICLVFTYLLSDEHLDKAEERMIKKIIKERLDK